MYVTLVPAATGGRAIGVAVADKPEGPFRDALGKPLVGPNWDYIDPTVFVDDDGQAYLYFGNPNPYYVLLNEDMISCSGSVNKVQVTTAGFGTRADGDERHRTLYEEGPWFYKRGDLYYLLYAASGIPENICYSTSPTPTGPWTFRGVIMESGGGSFTNHCGVCDFKGNSYFFYHTGKLPGGGGFTRSVAVEEFSYNADGSFPKLAMTDTGTEQLATLNPYQRVEAETMCWSEGIETETCASGGLDLANIENGDYVKIGGVLFDSGAAKLSASIASAEQGGNIELRLDSTDGKLIGNCEVPSTGAWQTWKTVSCDVENVTGKHDLYLCFTGGSGFLFNVDWWQFTAASCEPDANGYYFHDTFESTNDGWNGRGVASVSQSKAAAYAGDGALLTEGRTAAWNGASKALPSAAFQPGKSYSFSAIVRSAADDDAATFLLKLQYTDADATTQYATIAEATTAGDAWIQLANASFQIPADASELQLYVETAEGMQDFYVDEAIGAVDGTSIAGPKPQVTNPGDLNADGCINAIDLTLLKRGILNDFASTAVSGRADVNRDGAVDLLDVQLLQTFLLASITEFPAA